MSHVDEGLLHAYLDGAFSAGDARAEEIAAHLAVCGDCRVLLEQARALKERAQLVLQRVAPPAVRVPPFEELQARRVDALVAGRRPTRRGFTSPTRLAWAASLMLAIGAGWIANELSRGGRPDSASLVRVPASPAPEQASALAETAGSNAADADFSSEPSGESGRARTASESVGGRPAPVPVGAEPTRLRAAQPQVTAAPLSPNAAPTAARADELFAQRKASDSTSRRRNQLQPHPLALAELVVVPAAADTIGTLINDYVAVESTGAWRVESRAAVRDRVSGDLASIEGLNVVATELGRVESRSLARIVYRLEDGATVELVQRATQTAVVAGAAQRAAREGVIAARGRDDPSIVPLFGLDARSESFRSQSAVALRRPGLVLLLKGSVSQDSLAALAARVR